MHHSRKYRFTWPSLLAALAVACGLAACGGGATSEQPGSGGTTASAPAECSPEGSMEAKRQFAIHAGKAAFAYNRGIAKPVQEGRLEGGPIERRVARKATSRVAEYVLEWLDDARPHLYDDADLCTQAELFKGLVGDIRDLKPKLESGEATPSDLEASQKRLNELQSKLNFSEVESELIKRIPGL